MNDPGIRAEGQSGYRRVVRFLGQGENIAWGPGGKGSGPIMGPAFYYRSALPWVAAFMGRASHGGRASRSRTVQRRPEPCWTGGVAEGCSPKGNVE